MAVEIYLKIDSIQGESVDTGHTNEIDVLSFSDGVTMATGRTGLGHTTGKAVPSDILFTKPIDKATPKFFYNATTGIHIPSAIFTFRKAGGDGVKIDYLTVTLTDLIVSSYSHSGDTQANSEFLEHIGLNYATIKYSYQPQGKDGQKSGGTVDQGFDFLKHDKV